MKQREAFLISQQCVFTGTRESNENATKMSYDLTTLFAKYCKPFNEGKFIKYCVMKMADNICPKKQEYTNVCLAPNAVAWRIEDISSGIKRQLVARQVNCDIFSLARMHSVGVFWRGAEGKGNDEMNVTEEILNLQTLKDQIRGMNWFC